MNVRMRRGQTMVEYVFVLGVLVLSVVVVLTMFVGWVDLSGENHPGVVERYANRTERLVTADCP